MRFEVLGSLEARHDDGRSINVSRPQLRFLLVALLVNGNRTLSTERLVQLLWKTTGPANAQHAIHSYVSALRQLLKPSDVLTNQRPGYRLEIESGSLDIDVFHTLLADGEKHFLEADFDHAREKLKQACSIWRDASLPDFPDTLPMRGIGRKLVQELQLAEDLLVDSQLSTGRCYEVIPTLIARTTERPGRERAWAQLMIALYQSARRTEALEAYALARRSLIDEFGMEPGDMMRGLQLRILNDDVTLKTAPPLSVGLRISSKRF